MRLLLLLVLVLLSLSAADARSRRGRSPLSVLPSSPEYQTAFDRVRGVPYSVTHDERAIIVNGERVLLLSGSIHYPRFAEAEWSHQFNLSRMAGLNMIQTYVSACSTAVLPAASAHIIVATSHRHCVLALSVSVSFWNCQTAFPVSALPPSDSPLR